MADSDSSDVLANLPTGRPARRSSRRPAQAGQAATTTPAKAAPKPRATAAKASTPAKPKTTAKAKPAAAAKPKAAAAKTTAAAKPKVTAAKATPAKRTPAKPKAAAKPKTTTTRTTAAKATASKKTVATPATPTAGAVAQAAPTTPRTPARRTRMATPPEGRRSDSSAGGATHRARKVTTNRPWLPASGYALPESKDRPAIGIALEGLAAAIGDVARVGIGIAQSLTLRKRNELETPGDGESVETEPGPVRAGS